jgi:hypothetical protein
MMIVATYCVSYAKFLRESLEAASQLCDAIFLLDNDPTGEVRAIVNDFPKVDWELWNRPYHEAKTRAYGLKAALVDYKADWVIPLDGDEVVHLPVFIREVAHKDFNNGNCFFFKWLNFWDSRNTYRVDGNLGQWTFKKMFYVANRRDELLKDAEEWARTGRHCHAGYMPGEGWRAFPMPPFIIKHYSYMSPERRREKYGYYNRISPDRSYEHLLDEKVELREWK